MDNCINLIIKMSPRFVLGRENVPCIAEVVNRSLKADCTDFNTHETEVEREDSSSSIDNNDFLNGLLKLEIATELWITIYNSVLETF